MSSAAGQCDGWWRRSWWRVPVTAVQRPNPVHCDSSRTRPRPQSRPVPGAQVTATASATGWSREATTDASGQYLLRDLPPGGFVVSVTVAGFAPQRFEA